MHLLFVRHASAVPIDESSGRDAERVLSDRGKRRFEPVARQIAKLIDEPRAIFASPLVRARETAEMVAKAFGSVEVGLLPALVDGDWDTLWNTLRQFDDDDTVVLVGHEDWISTLTARLLGSAAGPAFAYRKGGLALLDVPSEGKNRATLVWFIPPRVLRRLRRAE